MKTGETYFIQGVRGGTPQPVPGLTSVDEVIQWSADGQSVYVFRSTDVPFRFERLDLSSGSRALIHEVSAADRTGVLRIMGPALTADAKSYEYSYLRMTSQLFVAEGAR